MKYEKKKKLKKKNWGDLLFHIRHFPTFQFSKTIFSYFSSKQKYEPFLD